MSKRGFDRAVCPRCQTSLDGAWRCASCGQEAQRLRSVVVLLPEPGLHIEYWRRQLGLVLQQGDEAPRALRSQAVESGIAPSTAVRLESLARAIAEQVGDIASIVGPALGGPLPPGDGIGLPRGATDYLTCLFRDWAWSDGHDPENSRAAAAIHWLANGRPLGRTLVLGAGAGRLAYDLHLREGGTHTTVVDVDPFLLVIAEAIVRGASVPLTESSVNAPEVDPVSRRWTLAAPEGPLGEDVFAFVLGNGLEPPFLDQTFDTIVTPWFIDQVPADLAALVRRLHGLLVPGGRWINQGPLIYRPDAVPVSRWYTRQELFELAGAIGFQVGAWESASQPHFVSPLSGRGLLENVLTFVATRG